MRSIFTCLLLVGFALTAPLRADVPAALKAVQSDVQALQEDLHAVREIFSQKTLSNSDKADLLRIAKNGMKTTSRATTTLKDAINEVVREVHGASMAKLQAAPADPFFPFSVDANTQSLLRAWVMSGQIQPAAAILDMAALNVKLVSDWLFFTEAAALGKGLRRIPYADFLIIHPYLKEALNTFARLVPEAPAIPVSFITREGKLELPDTGLTNLYASFTPVSGGNTPIKGMIRNAIKTVDAAYYHIQGYYRNYPQKGNDQGLQHVSNSLMAVKGVHSCVGLARGLSDFEGEPCDTKAFQAALNVYIRFYETNSGSNVQLLSTMLEFFASLKEEVGNKPSDEDLAELKEDLDRHVAIAKFHPMIKKRWPKVRDAIFADYDNLRMVLKRGPALHGFLQGNIASQGILPRRGFDGNYFENIQQAKQLRARFEGQRLATIPNNIKRLSAADSCKPYLEKTTSGGPQVVNTLVAADQDAMSVASTSGYRRLVWSHEVKVGDAYSIQNSQLKDKMLGGLATYTALRLVIPNIVYTKLLLGQGLGNKSLGSLGLKGEGPGALATVTRHYRFPEWDKIVGATESAYEESLLETQLNQEKLFVGDEDALMEKAQRDFVSRFRAQMNEGASRLRELHKWKGRIKKNWEAHANPPMTAIFGIIQEEGSDEARKMNRTVQRHLRYVIEDYICRKHDGYYTSGNFNRRNSRVIKQYYARYQRTFTIDQYIDQIGWYLGVDLRRRGDPETFARIMSRIEGGGSVRYIAQRRKELTSFNRRETGSDHVPREFLDIMWMYPIYAARLLNHTIDSYIRKLDYLEYAIKRLEYQFPQLMLKDTWKSYRDSHFRIAMTAFLNNAVTEANRVLALKTTQQTLNYFVKKTPIVEIMLRYHPDQKLAYCEEARDQKVWDDRIDTALEVTSMAAIGVSYVPVMAPVGMTVEAGVLMIKFYRTNEKRKELLQTEKLMFAASTQMDQSTWSVSNHYLREIEGAYNMALANFAIHAAAFTPAVAMKALPLLRFLPRALFRSPKALVRGIRAGWAEYRSATAAHRAAQAAMLKNMAIKDQSLWFARSSTKLARSLNLLNKVRHGFMWPFQRVLMATRWTNRSLYRSLLIRHSVKFARNPRLMMRYLRTYGARRIVTGTLTRPLGAALDVFTNVPWSLMGYQWGSGLLVRGVQAFGLYHMTTWIINAISGTREAATEIVMERVHQKPDDYVDLMDGMYNGDYRHEDLVTMIEIDDELGVPLREAANEQFEAFLAALTPQERTNCLGNLAKMQNELSIQIEGLEKEGDFDPNRWRILHRTRRHVVQKINSARVRQGG